MVTGHSLGGGVASILTLLINQHLKDVVTKGTVYSPPGGLLR